MYAQNIKIKWTDPAQIYFGSNGSAATIGRIEGSPDSPSRNLKPASWGGYLNPGEHGGANMRPGDYWIEPGDRAPDSANRHLQSTSFTRDKYNSLLFGKWWSKCWCHYFNKLYAGQEYE